MNWEAIGAIADIVGVGLVVVSLGHLRTSKLGILQ